ncbi:MAG: primosomal protein N' [Betaproteobacteria bacterium]|nr:primosomal protein N' [Betaproteobacteria bacterium]
MHIARVALDAPVDRLFDYLAPGCDEADLGRRVEVPFGRRTLVGVLLERVSVSDLPEAGLKPLHAIDRSTPALPADLIELARFAAGYYRFPLGAVLASLLPPALRRTERQRRDALPAAYALTGAGREAVAALPARAPAQRALAQRLLAGPVVRDDLDERERALVREWRRLGWLEAADAQNIPDAETPPALTEEQAAALIALDQHGDGYAATLLYGVTGSGKTEVYLRRIGAVIESGRQALVLAPEIHLIPQLEERLRRRFPARRILALHSGLAEGERRQDWLAALAGAADIVLGTRLSVFTPMPRLGLLIVDEEHDAAYKQLEGMRYSARDVAVWRAHQRGVPVILGSATPALETWKNAQDGRYHLIRLTRRAHAEAVLPAVRLVDTRGDRPRMGLTHSLGAALEDRLNRGEQSLVFINRRGYAPTLRCNACGHVTPCPRCTAHLVLHRAGPGYRLTCHHCGLTTRPPPACPECGSLDMRAAGQGTQRVEETLAERFPAARILRIDRDSTGRRGAFAVMRDQVAAREVDILVGTQLVAKGHDFPHLTLVGVIGADMALSSPDWRASERLFALLMQVAGRAGRAERPGEVLIQTGYPHHPLYQALIRHDYPGFARQTLNERRAAGFPPYSAQAVLRAEGRDGDAVMGFLEAARETGEGQEKGVALFDPVPALMSRIAHQTRAQLLVQATARAPLRRFLDLWLPRLGGLPGKGVKWGLDVDPIEG